MVWWCGGVVVWWCGVVWRGVVWRGVVCVLWCGVVWCGVVWCGVVWCGVVWCGVVWCGVRVLTGMDGSGVTPLEYGSLYSCMTCRQSAAAWRSCTSDTVLNSATRPLTRCVYTCTFCCSGHDDAGATIDTKFAMAGSTAFRVYSVVAGVKPPAKTSRPQRAFREETCASARACMCLLPGYEG